MPQIILPDSPRKSLELGAGRSCQLGVGLFAMLQGRQLLDGLSGLRLG
jgi:hypothetical protein